MASGHEYPIFIVSKGRHQNPITAKHFDKYGINYLIAVESNEYDSYVKVLGEKKVLKMPFNNLGLGSYPARNFCWEYAKSKGYKYYWCFDDNIRGFAKWQNGKKVFLENGILAINKVEQKANETNADILGFEYRYFVAKEPKNSFKFNTHVYSAMLIKTSLPFRWRLKYNEDIDLCLSVLHNGGTIYSCQKYMTNKVSTSAKMKGGNQDELYKENNYGKKLLKAKMIEYVWPQYCKTIIRFGRPHHLINWKVFKK